MLSQCDASMASDLEVRETMTCDFQHPANHKDHTNTWKNMVVLPSGGLLCEKQVFEKTLVC